MSAALHLLIISFLKLFVWEQFANDDKFRKLNDRTILVQELAIDNKIDNIDTIFCLTILPILLNNVIIVSKTLFARIFHN